MDADKALKDPTGSRFGSGLAFLVGESLLILGEDLSHPILRGGVDEQRQAMALIKAIIR